MLSDLAAFLFRELAAAAMMRAVFGIFNVVHVFKFTFRYRFILAWIHEPMKSTVRQGDG
jgi:hypothetical protein